MPRLCIPLTNQQLQDIRIKAAETSKATGSSLAMAEVGRRLLLAWVAGDVLTLGELDKLQLLADGVLLYSDSGDISEKLERMKGWAVE